MLERNTRNSKIQRALTLKTQTRLNSSSKNLKNSYYSSQNSKYSSKSRAWYMLELDSLKLELDIKWACSSTSKNLFHNARHDLSPKKQLLKHLCTGKTCAQFSTIIALVYGVSNLLLLQIAHKEFIIYALE